MGDHQTYTETLARNNEVLREILDCLRGGGEGRTGTGIIESQLDHIIRAQGELKAEVTHNREATQKGFDRISEDISEIKQDCRAMGQWQTDHEGRCERMDQDISSLQGRVNKMAAGNGLLAVIGSIIASVIGSQT